MPGVICQKWEESERDWGIRPDGYSIHLTEEDRLAYVKAYGEWLFKTYGRSAPDEYERVCGTPFQITVSAEDFNRLCELRMIEDHDRAYDKFGIRVYGKNPPQDPGVDGWVSMPGGGTGLK
jgi:hypothetical protein